MENGGMGNSETIYAKRQTANVKYKLIAHNPTQSQGSPPRADRQTAYTYT